MYNIICFMFICLDQRIWKNASYYMHSSFFSYFWYYNYINFPFIFLPPNPYLLFSSAVLSRWGAGHVLWNAAASEGQTQLVPLSWLWGNSPSYHRNKGPGEAGRASFPCPLYHMADEGCGQILHQLSICSRWQGGWGERGISPLLMPPCDRQLVELAFFLSGWAHPHTPLWGHLYCAVY